MIPINVEIAESAKFRSFSRKARNMELQAFPAFDVRPTPAYIESWREHISETGSPETFEYVSTTQPPKTASVILLSEEMRVPTSLRLGGDRVPCPLCSPMAPKFGTGRMAWFPDERVVRFIGHSCARHYLGENYSAAERLFKIEAACARYLELWPQLQEHRSELCAVAKKLNTVARGERMTRALLDQRAPKFVTFLFRDRVNRPDGIATSQTRGAKTTIIKGMDFISEDFHPNKQTDKLVKVCNDLWTDLPAWKQIDGESDAAKEIVRRGRKAEVAIREIADLDRYVRDARKFLLPENLRLLEQWSNAGLSPFGTLKMRRDDNYFHLKAEWHEIGYEITMPIHSDFDGPLPNEEELARVNLLEILN